LKAQSIYLQFIQIIDLLSINFWIIVTSFMQKYNDKDEKPVAQNTKQIKKKKKNIFSATIIDSILDLWQFPTYH
jgi:hypothetical protein